MRSIRQATSMTQYPSIIEKKTFLVFSELFMFADRTASSMWLTPSSKRMRKTL